MKRMEPKPCEICGKIFVPRRGGQRTCGSEPCKKARQKLNYLEYRERNYSRVLETNRRARQGRLDKARRGASLKEDAIVAIGYAERQVEATLKLAGRVNTEL